MSTLKVTEKINLAKQFTADQRTIESASASNESPERTLELQKTLDSKHDKVNNIEDVQANHHAPSHGLPVQTNSNVDLQGQQSDVVMTNQEPPKMESIEEKPLTQKQIDNLIQIIKMNLDTYPNNLPEEP